MITRKCTLYINLPVEKSAVRCWTAENIRSLSGQLGKIQMHTYNIIGAFNFEGGWIVYKQNISEVVK